MRASPVGGFEWPPCFLFVVKGCVDLPHQKHDLKAECHATTQFEIHRPFEIRPFEIGADQEAPAS